MNIMERTSEYCGQCSHGEAEVSLNIKVGLVFVTGHIVIKCQSKQ